MPGKKLAVADSPAEVAQQAVTDGEGDTAATFVERCSQLALRQFWNNTTKSINARQI